MNELRKIEIELSIVEKRFYKYKAKRLQLRERFVKLSNSLANASNESRFTEALEYLETLNYINKQIDETENIMKSCLKKREKLNKKYWKIEKSLMKK